MKKFLAALLVTTAICVVPSAAEADPISTAIVASLSLTGTFAGAAIGAAISLGLSVAGGYIASLFMKQPEPPKAGGVNGQLRAGGTMPCSFIIGRWATGGSLSYAGTWGSVGGTPNSFLVYDVALSDLSCEGLAGLFVNGEPATYTETGAHADGRGYPVAEYNTGGEDYLWVKFIEGSDSPVVDAYMSSKFGTHPTRPYTSDMLGTNISRVIVTVRVNPELFTGFPEFVWVVDGIPLFDPRLSTEAGGSGSQEWDDQSTWTTAGKRNPAIQVYNILRGIKRGSQWVWGGQTFQPYQLPYSSYAAGANECDVSTPKVSGSEPQFESGAEIRFSDQPIETIESLAMSANMRIAEVAGQYKIHVGAAGSAVMAFTDGDLIVDDEATFRPYASISSTVNAIAANYIEPLEGWVPKDAPTRLNPDLEVLDGNRRLMVTVSYGHVASGTQAQRLMNAALLEARRERQHVVYLGPKAWPVEPNDYVLWNSTRNGYVDKLFRVDRVDDLDKLNVKWALTEVDPADYDWVAADDEIEISTGSTTIQRPPSQAIVDWFVEPWTIIGDTSSERPGIRLSWDPDVDDVDGVLFEVRLQDGAELVLDGATDFWDRGSIILSANLLPSTTYEARGKYRPASARPTSWSSWLPVTTIATGTVSQDDLSAALQALLQRLNSRLPTDLLEIRQMIESLASTVNENFTLMREGDGQINIGVGARFNENKAGVEIAQLAATTANSALAALFVDLFATTPQGTANALMRFVAASAPEGVAASFALETRATTEDDFAIAGIYLDAGVTALGGLSRIRMVADLITLSTPGGAVLNALLISVQDVPNETEVTIEASQYVIRADLSGRQARQYTKHAVAAEVRAPTGITSMDYTHMFEQDLTGGHTLTFSDEFLDPQPSGLSTVPGAINLIRCSVLNTNPIEIAADLVSSFVRTPTLLFRDRAEYFTAGTSAGAYPASFPGLDVRPGNLLVACCQGFATRIGGGGGSFVNIADAGLTSGWQEGFSHNEGGAAGRFLWKIADGTETSVTAFAFTVSGATLHAKAIYQIFSFDCLGGSIEFVAGSGFGDYKNSSFGATDVGPFVMPLNGLGGPAVAFAMAGNDNDSGAVISEAGLDITFSPTATGDFSFAGNASNPGVRCEVKYKLYSTSPAPADISAQVGNNTNTNGLVTCAFQMV